MANYRAVARRKARKYGLDPRIFERQIDAESGFNPHVRSGAGAQGIAQIMPGTAKSWGVDPWDSEAALDAAAKNMARYVRKYGSYRKALAAYNAGEGAVQKYNGVPPYSETQNYVKKILGGIGKATYPGQNPAPAKQKAPGQQTTPEEPQIPLVAQATPVPQISFSAPQTPQMLDSSQYLAGPAGPTGQGPQPLPATPPAPVQAPELVAPQPEAAAAEAPATGLPPKIRVKKQSAGKNPWSIPAKYGLTVTSGKRPGSITTSGNISDHTHSEPGMMARDFGGSVAQMDKAAKEMARHFGLDPKKIMKGGLFNFNRDGYRYQLIYRTNIGGNHYNHIHLGRRKI